MSDAAASPLRRSLWPLSSLYWIATAVRNAGYSSGVLRSHSLDVPVISVGNITVGGTGKTPLVVWLVGEARRLGLRPGVLARGYGREPGAELNDEGQLLAARFDGLPQVQDPDRVAGGVRLVETHDVDVVLLDDGFQHRRLVRDRDLVCLDAVRPFGPGALLPAGDLRESARGALQRADVLILTRADRLGGASAIASRARQLREFARRELPVFACHHRPTEVVDLQSGDAADLESIRARRVVLLSAIAKPARFRDSVEALGAEVVAEIGLRDHHRYTASEVAVHARRARELGAELLTTEKDAVKLRPLEVDARWLRIDLDWLGVAPTAIDLGLPVGGG